jgi:trimethylamine--corrinoid protein Co-methyltransferase
VGSIQRPPIEPLKCDFRVAFHSKEQLDLLKQATLDILETVGVQFQSAKALAILEAAGARVDHETQIVKFPPDLVLSSMAKAPRYFPFAARDASCDIDMSDGRTYCTTDGCGVEIVDLKTRQHRMSTKADLVQITRLTDYLPAIAFWWPTVGAGDCGETAQLHELGAGFNNTVKHIQGMVQGEKLARYAVEMATVIAGSAEELRRRPVLSDLIGVISPLVQDKDGIEAALVFAEADVPVIFVTMPTLGTTAPATKAGAFAQAAAENVSATVLLQIAHPGAPVGHSILQSYADPRTGSMISWPLDSRCRFLATEVAHSWGVPNLAGFSSTDSEMPGTWQAAVEASQDMSLFGFEGAELATGIGLTNVYTRFCPEHLMLDYDIYTRGRYALLDIEFNEETLAIDVMKKVGPGGHFLGTPHTRKFMRDAVVRGITHVAGADGHFRDPIDVARERADEIMTNYEPEPLDADKAAELTKILARADAELRS